VSQVVDFAHVEDMLPEGATPLYAWRLVYFVAADGEENFQWRIEGDPLVPVSVGTLEMAKMDLIHNASQIGHIDEDDDE